MPAVTPPGTWRERANHALVELACREGPTMAPSLMRVGLALLLWARWSNELQPFTAHGPGWLLLGAAFYTSTAAMLLGWHARLSTAAAAAVVWTMVFAVGRSGAVFSWTHHHTTLLAYAVALLALTPCGGNLSIDRWLAVRDAARRGEPRPPARGPLWAVPLLGVLVSTIYLWGAVDKVSVGFLTGARLEQIWIHTYASSDFFPVGPVHALFVASAVGATALELGLAVGLWHRPWQRWLMPVGIVLHAAFYLLLPQVQTFSLTMIVLYLAYLDPQDVAGAVDRVS